LAIYLAFAQGLYYLLTGVWPLISIRTFQEVTGPKQDLWLVKTVGVLIMVIGGVLLVAAARWQPSLEVALLAVGSAVGLTCIDVIYVAKRRIAPVYLLDAALEVPLIALWVLTWL
jgi:hypothetical protein